jgi:hypothetical protein
MNKKVPPLLAELFLFEKTGCLLQVVEKAEVGSTSNSLTRFRTRSSCNFFATPARLAAGLGTKDYPFITL